jgi:hypothetical protein
VKAGNQLQKLLLELSWRVYNWEMVRAFVDGLEDILPEEVEFGWLRKDGYETRIHSHYRIAIMELLSHNKSALKITLPGCLWADNYSDHEIYKALDLNTTVRSLTFNAPHKVNIWSYSHQSVIDCFAKMFVHPSLRHLSISDYLNQSAIVSEDSKYTSLYFADPECFSKSTLETLHIELGQEAPLGLLHVLFSVADMPKLEKFTMSWPTGGYPVQQICMERLHKFLEAKGQSEIYKTRSKLILCGDDESYGTVPWNMLTTLFV